MDKLTITQKDKGVRLDKYLASIGTNLSRSQIKKRILSGGIKVNGKNVAVHTFLKIGDEIVWHDIQVSQAGQPEASRESKAYEPEIIFEDDNYVVLNKPAGMLVHTAAAANEKNTLADWLQMKYPDIISVGEEKYRAGIIHRLDRDVSGVMVAVKNNQAYDHLKQQFKNRKVKKIYHAFVYGKMETEKGEIDLPIGRAKIGKFVAHPRIGKDKLKDRDKIAKTIYWTENVIKNFSLLKVQILTGRTHQIRAHLSAVGHPILGDAMYLQQKPFFKMFSKKIKVLHPGRIMLHSSQIGFYNLDDSWQEFDCPPPKNFTDFINAQKN